MVAGVATPGQFVFLGQTFEVCAGQIVEQQIVVELKERAQSFLDSGFDRVLGLEELVERAIEPVLGDGGVGHAEQILQSRGPIPVLGERKLAAGLAQTIDDLDGHDVDRAYGFFALGHLAVDDVVQAEELPEPACQPNIAKAAGIGPGDLTEANAHHIGIIGQSKVLVFGEEPQLLSIALAVVKNDGALPTAFLLVIEFAEVSDDSLPWPSIGAHALDESIVGMGLALFGPLIASQKHSCLLGPSMAKEFGNLQGSRFPLHRQNDLSTTQNAGNLQQEGSKIAEILSQLRNIG